MGTVKIKSRIRKVSTTCRRHEWSRTESCTWPAMSEVVTIGQGTIWYQVHRIFTWYRPPTVPSGSFVSDSILDVHAVLSSANSTQLQQVQIMLADKRYRGSCQRPDLHAKRPRQEHIRPCWHMLVYHCSGFSRGACYDFVGFIWGLAESDTSTFASTNLQTPSKIC